MRTHLSGPEGATQLLISEFIEVLRQCPLVFGSKVTVHYSRTKELEGRNTDTIQKGDIEKIANDIRKTASWAKAI